ncbi:MAG: SDR family oxidoreductase [Candidatus Pacearchaeota archaeon]
MAKKIFLTGGTGNLGRELLNELLIKTDLKIYLLIHNTGNGLNKEKLFELLKLEKNKDFLSRVVICKGDITKKNLGLNKKVCSELINEIDLFLHAAALTSFNLPLDKIRRVNVEGTRNLLRLIKKCKNLKKFVFLSTIYVCGKRTGVISENEREHKAGFVNTYEQSKYEAEAVVEEFWYELPISIYRISTLIGNSESGEVTKFIAPHQALEMIYLGLASMMPGKPDYYIDLIPNDTCAEIVLDLFNNHFESKKVFHIISGKDKSYNLKEIIDQSCYFLARYDSAWGKIDYPKPILVEQETFELFIESIKKADNPIFSIVLNSIKNFAEQLNYPKIFDMNNIREVNPNYEKLIPHVKEYYPKVVKYCLETNWGKNAKTK